MWMAILLFELILADELADLLADLPTPCRSANGSEWKFYSWSSYWLMNWQILWQIFPFPIGLPMDLNGNFTLWAHIGRWSGRSPGTYTNPPVDLPMELNGNFTLWGHIGRWSGRSAPPLCRSANEYEWQFFCYSSYWQMKWQIHWQIYPPPVDLSMDLNGNFTVTAQIGSWSGRSTGRSTLPPVDWPMDLNGNSTLWAHIGWWIGRLIDLPPTHISSNGSEWQFYSLSSYGQIYWHFYPTHL